MIFDLMGMLNKIYMCGHVQLDDGESRAKSLAAVGLTFKTKSWKRSLAIVIMIVSVPRLNETE